LHNLTSRVSAPYEGVASLFHVGSKHDAIADVNLSNSNLPMLAAAIDSPVGVVNNHGLLIIEEINTASTLRGGL